MIVTAVLKKTRSDDGIFQMHEDVRVGKRYRVILDSRRIRRVSNPVLMRVVDREMIQDADTLEWLPVELLDIQKT